MLTINGADFDISMDFETLAAEIRLLAQLRLL